MQTERRNTKNTPLPQKNKRIIASVALGFLLTATSLVAAPVVNDQPVEAGIWGMWDFETSMQPNDPLYDGDWLKGTMLSVDWSEIKPSRNGAYKWGPLNTKLNAALANVEQVMLIVYHANASPTWIYSRPNGQKVKKSEYNQQDGGVPEVCYKGNNQNRKYPDYRDPDYKTLLKQMITDVANHIKGNNNYKNLVTIVQCPIGKSGDPNPYDPKGAVTFSNGYTSFPVGKNTSFWTNWEKDISAHYLNAYKPAGIKVLYKPANIGTFNNQEPFISNKANIMVKTTFVSHGYQNQNETTNLVGTARDRAAKFLIRGELAEPLNKLIGKGPKYNITDNQYWNDKPRQNLYWQCLWMLHLGMDVFNIRDLENFEDGTKNAHCWDEARETFQFFSERAGIKNAKADLNNYNQRLASDKPWKSKYAFIALREGLSYESKKYVSYSGANPPPLKSNNQANAPATNRMNAIINTVNNLLGSDGHVANGDMPQAIKDAKPLFYLKELEGVNDVNSNIYEGNYTMFITQIDSDATSQGYWNMGHPESNNNKAQQYGRFAKGFKAGKSKMYFDVDKNFFSSNDNVNPGNGYKIRIDVIYLDKGNAKFRLKFDGDNGQFTAYTHTTGNTNDFIKKSFTTTAARFKNNLEKGADIILEKVSGKPIFHMIEVVKIDDGVGSGGPPTINNIANLTVNEGGSKSRNITATGSNGNSVITLSATGLPGWAVFSDNGNGNGSIDFSPLHWVVAHPDTSKTWNVTVTADDGNNGSISESFVLTVNDVNRDPALGPINNVTMNELESIVIDINATDADNDAITLLATGLPQYGIAFNDNGDGTGSITYDPYYQASGTYSITVEADDGLNGLGTESFTITVNNVNRDPSFSAPIGDVTLDEGATVTVSFSTTDPDQGEIASFSATGLPSFGTLIDNGDGTGSIDLSPGSNDSGLYTVTVIAEDIHNASASESFTITVNDVSTPVDVTYEIENLTVLDSSDDDITPIYNANASGTGNPNIILLTSNEDGDFIDFEVDIPEAGSYDIIVGVQKTPNSGQAQLSVKYTSIPNEVVGTQDLYNSSYSITSVNFGSKTFTADGPRTFSFEVVGKNANSNNRRMRFDYIRLVKTN